MNLQNLQVLILLTLRNLKFDGFEALNLLECSDFDMVILDIMMPGMNGYETAIEIRKKHSMPIMFLSAKNQDIDKIMGLDIGADDYNNRKWL